MGAKSIKLVSSKKHPAQTCLVGVIGALVIFVIVIIGLSSAKDKF